MSYADGCVKRYEACYRAPGFDSTGASAGQDVLSIYMGAKNTSVTGSYTVDWYVRPLTRFR